MSRRLAIWLFLVILLVALVAVAAANAPGAATNLSTPLSRHGVTYSGTVVQDGDGRAAVAMVPIYNVLNDGDTPADGGSTGGDDVVRMIDAIAEDADSWDAVILELDTPGGSVTASEEIHDAITRLKDETDLPVLAWMRGTAASAGYYVSAVADQIVAANTTFTGSIGVILEYYVVEELAKDVGVEAVTIKSGKLKDIGSPFRDATPEERQLFQAIIDEAYDQFVGVVADGRDMDEDEVRELADGRVYTGRQAKENGLVDTLGLRRTAYDEVADLIDRRDLDGEDLDVVEFSRSYGFLEMLGAESGSAFNSLQAIGEVGRAVGGDAAAVGRLAHGTAGATRVGGGLATVEYRAEFGG